MQQFASFDRPDITGIDRDEGNRLAATIDELDFVSATLIVYVYYRANISAIQLVVRRISVQNNQRMFSNHYVPFSWSYQILMSFEPLSTGDSDSG